MSTESETAAMLRRAFDRSFSEARILETEAFVDVLLIQVGNDSFALRTSEIGSLHEGKKVVPVPSDASELLGVAAVRGVMVPVYDLSLLLGYGASNKPRWLIVSRDQRRIGFAFDTFQQHLRLPESALSNVDARMSATSHVRGALRVDGAVYSVLHLSSVLERAAVRTDAAKRGGENL